MSQDERIARVRMVFGQVTAELPGGMQMGEPRIHAGRARQYLYFATTRRDADLRVSARVNSSSYPRNGNDISFPYPMVQLIAGDMPQATFYPRPPQEGGLAAEMMVPPRQGGGVIISASPVWFGHVAIDIDFEMVPILFTPRQRRTEEMRIEAERSMETILDREAADTLHVTIWRSLCDYTWSDHLDDAELSSKSFFIYHDRGSIFTEEQLALVAKAGGWWTYDDVGHGVFVPLAAWLPRFEMWYEKLEQRLALHGMSQKKPLARNV